MQEDAEAAVIEPRKRKREPSLPASAALIFTSPDLEFFLKSFSHRPVKTHGLYLTNVYTSSDSGVEIALAGPVLGAPQAVMVLERLIALGVRNVVAAGWCGSLQPHVRIGDLVLPSSALSEEGTSAHYPLEEGVSPGASPDLLGSLKRSMEARGAKYHEGAVWTTDAPFRETVRKVLAHQRRGTLAVEMETSALFTLSAFRKIRAAVALAVSDDLSGLKWVHGFREPGFKAARENLAACVLEVLRSTADFAS